MFKEYDSKPIKRKAHQITIDDDLHEQNGLHYIFFKDDKGNDAQCITFKAHQKVSVGDWIVYLNDEDVYHCTDAVFLERNLVPGRNC